MTRRKPLRSKSQLRARKPLRRTTRFMRGNRKTKYARRERDFAFMGWVKTRPCIAIALPPFLFIGHPARAALYKTTPCEGCIEADHAGARGIGQKAADDTCIPLCSSHHSQRTNHTGVFWQLNQQELRAWRAQAIERTQAAWENR
jgi:hypothetical protein